MGRGITLTKKVGGVCYSQGTLGTLRVPVQHALTGVAIQKDWP